MPPPPVMKADGYRMPAEWEPHDATWLAWPHFRMDWPGKFEPIPWAYAELIRYLAKRERVEVIVKNVRSVPRATDVLERSGAMHQNINFHVWPTNRVWLRDSGCTFVVRRPAEGEYVAEEGRAPLAAIKWRFNAWAKYTNWDLDDKVGSKIAEAASALEIRAYQGKDVAVLEGGAIDCNGRGTLLTTEECLLGTEQPRNPTFTRNDYEKLFESYLGIKHVIWLGAGITGDDTRGHVDDLARFVSPDTVVTVVETNKRDPNYKALRDNLKRLSAANDQNGKRLNVVELPMPQAVLFNRIQLPASYANFYIANGLVLVPVFNDVNDRTALDVMARL